MTIGVFSKQDPRRRRVKILCLSTRPGGGVGKRGADVGRTQTMDSPSVGVGKTYSTGGVDSFQWQLSNSRQGCFKLGTMTGVIQLGFCACWRRKYVGWEAHTADSLRTLSRDGRMSLGDGRLEMNMYVDLRSVSIPLVFRFSDLYLVIYPVTSIYSGKTNQRWIGQYVPRTQQRSKSNQAKRR